MKLLFNTIFILCLFAAMDAVVTDEEEDDDHLSQIASTIMQHLNNEHTPLSNSAGSSGSHSAPVIHQIIGQQAIVNHALLGRNVTNIKASVGVAGIRFVSVELNGKVVNITTKFGVGAAAVYTITSGDDDDDKRDDVYKYEVVDDDESSYQEVTDLLKPITDKYTDLDRKAAPNETSVLLGQKAKFGLRVKVNARGSGPGDFTARVKHGFIVCARTNVTRGTI